MLGSLELRLLLNGTSQPQAITLSELGEQEDIANVHVTVSDFVVGKSLVVESKGDRWTRVWVPLLEPDGSWSDRPVVAIVTGVRSEAELPPKIGRPALTGVITDGAFISLDQRHREKFAERYPRIDFSNAITLHVDRRFPSPVVTALVLAVGIVSLAAAIYLTFFRR